MSNDPEIIYTELHLVGVQDIGKKSGWLIGLGIFLILLGTIAVGASVLVTLATMVFTGSLMLMAGILQTLYAIMMRRWSGFYVDLLAGILNGVIGVLIIGHPGTTAAALTLIIAILLILGGAFRLLTGFSVNYQNRNWLIFHGVVNLLLAYVILSDWPLSGAWLIGTFIGIDMIFNGWSLVMLGLVVRRGIPG